MNTKEVRDLEMEFWKPSVGGLAPFHRIPHDVETLVSASQVFRERASFLADAAAQIEHGLVRLEPGMVYQEILNEARSDLRVVCQAYRAVGK